MKRFILVDDHPVFRQGLAALIQSEPSYKVVAETSSIEEVLEVLPRVRADIILVDITLHNQNGLDLARTLRSQEPDLPILMVSMHDEGVYAQRALQTGARGYVMKHASPDVLMEAIRTVLAGKIYLSPAIQGRILESMYGQNQQGSSGTAALIDRLSQRELEIFQYIGQGFGASEIADILNLSVKTVHTYRDHLKEKLQIDNAQELRRFAIKWHQSLHGAPGTAP
ncbi:response regulator transcription factor [Spirochaeta lutea]|uniref:LuxR family transcriptional regulator n=1 Tax=Spirochaeta lutea TaxID=1480694 RepID=A0A098QUB2_9SPIO|nr:response regulator transcription factor [Spirochaeta lutea]KGE70983.1 LuxR family transcriptional regulator [Spirochaeta lutea]